VRHQDQPCIGPLSSKPLKRLEYDVLIGRPGGTRHKCRRTPAKAKERLVWRNAAHSFCHAVETWVAQDSNALRQHPELLEAAPVFLSDDCRRGHGTVTRTENVPNRFSKPAAPGTHGSGNQRNPGSGISGAGRQLRPHIQLYENEEIGRQRSKQESHLTSQIPGQVIRHVGFDVPSELLGGGA
jgi:hypothetical protein